MAFLAGVLVAVFAGGVVGTLAVTGFFKGKDEAGLVATAPPLTVKQTEPERQKLTTTAVSVVTQASPPAKIAEIKPTPVTDPLQPAPVKPPAEVAPSAEARGPLPPTIQPDTVRKVKHSTVYLKVTLGNGPTAEGSGFFAIQPGIIVTNAHVVGMLQAGAELPKNVEVVVNSGDQGETRLAGTVLGVDRQCDLAILHVSGGQGSLPPPLAVDLDMAALTELQPVYIFGFPLGAGLGKEITVNRSEIASFRKDTDGSLYQIQVNGGMHPGNSGGPVVDSRGVVIGVSVAGIQATNINFAVPGDKIHGMLHGRVLDTQLGERFRDNQDIKLPVAIAFLDPLERVREVKLDFWTGPSGAARPPSLKEPTPAPGDAPVQSVVMAYSKGQAKQDLVLPLLPPGQVYWLRAQFVDQDGVRQWAAASPYQPSEAPPLDRVPANLTVACETQERSLKLLSRYIFQVTRGKQKQADTSEADLQILESLQKNAAGAQVKLALGKSSFYDIDRGRKLPRNALAQSAVRRNVFTYQTDVGGRLTSFTFVTMQLRDPLSTVEANGMSADVTTSYQGVCLGMPNRQVAPLESWQEKIRMLFGGDRKKKEAMDLVLTCSYEGSRTVNGSTEALIRLSGEVKLVNQNQGKFFRQPREKVNGFALFDVSKGFITRLKLALNAEFDLEGLILSRTVELDLTRAAGNTFGISMPAAGPRVAGNDGGGVPTDSGPFNPLPQSKPMPEAGAAPKAAALNQGESKEIELSSTIQEACAGGGGKKIIVHLLQEEKLAVIDVVAGKIAGHIPAKGSRLFFAAGKNDLILILLDEKLMETWNLETLKKTASRALPGTGAVKALAMGANSTGPALVLLSEGMQALDHVKAYWLTPALKIYPAQTDTFRGTAYRDSVRIRASADGRLYGIWIAGQSPTGVGVLVVGNPVLRYYYAHESAGDLVPSATGRFVCTFGGLYSTQAQPLHIGNGRCLPALEGNYYLSLGKLPLLDNKPMTIEAEAMTFGKSEALGRVPIQNVSTAHVFSDFALDKHVYFLPVSGYLVTLPHLNDRVVVTRLNLKKTG
jgi:S1-C subfamily serine protease